MLDIELHTSSRGAQSSFFIGMTAEQPATAQLVKTRVASSLTVTPSTSFRQRNQEEVPTLTTSQRCVSTFACYLFLWVALLCAEPFATDSFVNSQLRGFLSYECFIQFCFDPVCIFKPRDVSYSFLVKNLEIHVVFLCVADQVLILLASAYSDHSVIVQASFAKVSSFSSFLVIIIDSFQEASQRGV